MRTARFILSTLSVGSFFASALALPSPQQGDPRGPPRVHHRPSTSSTQAAATASTIPIAGDPALPGPVDEATDAKANTETEVPSSGVNVAVLDTGVIPVPPEGNNIVEVLFCTTAFVVGGAGRIGFLVTHHDGTALKNETVAFQNDGPEAYLAYELLKSHTNPNGFWEDVNIFGSTKGLNVGYHPTGKTLNVAGWTPNIQYNGNNQFEKVETFCRDQFGIKADGPTGSYYNLYAAPVGSYIPGLFTPSA